MEGDDRRHKGLNTPMSDSLFPADDPICCRPHLHAAFIVLARHGGSHAGFGTSSRHDNKCAENCQHGSTRDNNSRLE